MLKRFWQSTSGNFALMFAIVLPAVLGGVGLALDISNLMAAKSNLQNALDSAVLAASRLKDNSSSREDTFQAFFNANVAGNAILANATASFKVDPGANYIRTNATANADIHLNFGFLFGDSAKVSVKASAYESTAKLEVALVLDNTGSMGRANMDALIAGARDLIKVLQGEKAKKPEREIRAALVPFVTAVNIKSAVGFKQSWIDTRTAVPVNDPSSNGKNFDYIKDSNNKDQRIGQWALFNKLVAKWNGTGLSGAWKGCVEARLGANALDDTAPDPTKPETLFVPYFAPDEPGIAAKSGNSATAINNSYLDDVITNGDDRAKQKSLAKYDNQAARNNAKIAETPNVTNGPNFACATPIVPLTDDLAGLAGDPSKNIKGEIDKMDFWNGSGTNVSEGLAWGYRVLSPTEPFTQGDAFNSEDTTKIVVVFTDGENVVYGASSATINKSDYGAYGFLDEGRMGSTNRATALTNLNTATQTMCTRLKDQGVTIYTVVLNADTPANRVLYSTCASNPSYYFPTKNVTELRAAFQSIAYSITQLYVTN